MSAEPDRSFLAAVQDIAGEVGYDAEGDGSTGLLIDYKNALEEHATGLAAALDRLVDHYTHGTLDPLNRRAVLGDLLVLRHGGLGAPDSRLAKLRLEVLKARLAVAEDEARWADPIVAAGQDTEEAESSGVLAGYADGLERAVTVMEGGA